MSKQETEFPSLNMERVKITDIDPGISDVVQVLWDAGYETADSGDGRAKPMIDGVIPFEHVVFREGVLYPPEEILERIEVIRPGRSWRVENIIACETGKKTRRITIASRVATEESEVVNE